MAKVDDLSDGFNHGFSANPQNARKSKGAEKRADGEMYKRPEPNPFTSEWITGYDDCIEGKSYNPLNAGGNPQNYRDGFQTAEADKEELDRTGSSNA